MQLDTTSLKLPQHNLDSPLDGRMVRAVASDKLLDNGAERRWRQSRMGDAHRISLQHKLQSALALVRRARHLAAGRIPKFGHKKRILEERQRQNVNDITGAKSD